MKLTSKKISGIILVDKELKTHLFNIVTSKDSTEDDEYVNDIVSNEVNTLKLSEIVEIITNFDSNDKICQFHETIGIDRFESNMRYVVFNAVKNNLISDILKTEEYKKWELKRQIENLI
jgi:hypothetical protein